MQIISLAIEGNLIELVIAAIGVVMVVGGWVVNQLREMKEKARRQENPRSPAQEAELRKSAAATQAERLKKQQEMAERRRAQLQELARRRQQAKQSGGRTPTRTSEQRQPVAEEASPTENVGTHEAARRAQARAEYERRRQALAQQRNRAEAQRLAAQKAARAQQAQRQRPAERRPERKSLVTLGEIRDDQHVDADTGESVTHRHLADAQIPVGEAPGVAKSWESQLSGKNLRQAILLKEILAPPIALRDPQDDAGYW